MKVIFVQRRSKIISKNGIRSHIESGISFCRQAKDLEKNPKANDITLVTMYSEPTECNESYIGVKLNQKDIQKSSPKIIIQKSCHSESS